MNYLDVYHARCGNRGEKHKEREYRAGLKSFEAYLDTHPSSTDVLLNGTPTRVSIISNRQDQFSLTKKVLAPIDTAMGPGSMIQWDDQHWIVYQRSRQPNQTYITCFMIRCNASVAWVDDYGVRRECYCHALSSQDSVVKANYRTWQGQITPQPNQFMEILVSTDDRIRLGQKFIIDQRCWEVLESDKTSAPGITYYSLTQSKVDRMDDDVELSLVDKFKLGKAYIEITDMAVAEHDIVVFQPRLWNQNKYQAAEFSFIYDADGLDIRDGKLRAWRAGEYTVSVYVTAAPEVAKTILVTVGLATAPVYKLYGPKQLRISEQGIYYVMREAVSKEMVPITAWTLSNKLATAKLRDGKLYVVANEDNKIGTTQLTLTTAESTHTLDLIIRSLW